MSSTSEGGRGRPRASSREMLEEAAYELFLEQGYVQTTAAQIASRAGVSRGTFFNYFATKADVFWVDLDRSISQLPATFQGTDPSLSAPDAVRYGLLAATRAFGPERVPWILTQFEAIGSPAEVRGAAVERITEVARVLEQFIADRDAGVGSVHSPLTLAYAAVGAVIAAAQEWAAAGHARGPLSSHLEDSFATLTGIFPGIAENR